MARTKKADQPMTTAQQLGAIVKSSRQIMRKDKGLNGDLDRLPMLTWIMFLKFLDDLEQMRETEAVLEGKKFQPAIEAPYRWRDWAAIEGGITGDELIAFINNDEAVRPDGTRGVGLFAYLRSLQGENGGDRRDVIATVFKGMQNRMINGYLLRDVVDKINGIHFNSSEEMHTLSRLYETMLREMRDAAGDSGEFYTPRPVVRFMVEVTNPQLGETVLDPACGTGGFLVEAFEHLERQCKTVEDREILQESSIYGGEAKSLPYLLVQMNLLLHGLEYPRIDPENSLRFPLREMGDKDRVDVILTNPPFGGEEEKGILGNFPEDMQSSETTLLFLQLVMRKLKRSGQDSDIGGRAAVVVPNGTLYESGVAERIRRQLLSDFNLKVVYRFPKGVFEPYTDISTNILFFERGAQEEHVWFYEHPLPSHRAHLKNNCYSPSDALTYEEMLPAIDWFENPVENENAWSVPVSDLLSGTCDFALMHPKHEKVILPSPRELIESSCKIGRSLPRELSELENLLKTVQLIDAPLARLGDVLQQRNDRISIQDDVLYTRPRIQLHFRGGKVRDTAHGVDIGTKSQTVIHTNDLILSRIDARNGAMAIVSSDLDGAIATNDFPVFEIDTNKIIPSFLRYVLFQPQMIRIYEKISRGSTNRRRMDMPSFLDLKIPLPELDSQIEIASILEQAEQKVSSLNDMLAVIKDEVDSVLAATLHATFEG